MTTPRSVRATRTLALLGAVVALATLALPGGSATAAPTVPAAATGGCREVGGGTVTSSGPHRATVVVDTGSGDVWSACISFSGTISGVEAIELAAEQIPNLDPVYDLYAGEGRAICQLLGVGNPPPDCLGKSVDYWGYFHDGRYASSGAGRVILSDGDVDGWRWGRDARTGPRAATRGTAATAAIPPATTTTTRPGSTTTTRPPADGGLSGTPGRPGDPGTPADPGGATTVPGATTTRPGATTTTATGATTTTTAGDGDDPGATTAPSGEGGGTGDGGSGGADDRAAGAEPTPVADGRAGSGSPVGSIAGFGLAVVAVVGVGLALRKRREATT